jgi:hypothetical protein
MERAVEERGVEDVDAWMEGGEGNTAAGPVAGRLAEWPVAASPSRAALCLCLTILLRASGWSWLRQSPSAAAAVA